MQDIFKQKSKKMKTVNLDKIMMYSALVFALLAMAGILYFCYDYAKTGVLNYQVRSLSLSFVSLICSYIVIKKTSNDSNRVKKSN